MGISKEFQQRMSQKVTQFTDTDKLLGSQSIKHNMFVSYTMSVADHFTVLKFYTKGRI